MSSAGEPDSLPPLSSIPSFDINSTLGAMFIGILITYFLCGVTCLQTYIYFMNANKRDALPYRAIVAFLWVLDVLHLGFATHDAYSVIILSFLNPANVAVIS
ncbi:hypothetical protein ABKN59_011678 [Abortiporus biennis]